MVLSTLDTKQQLNWKITNCQMTSVSLNGIQLSFVACDGESCSKQEAVVQFDPPLTSASEYRYVCIRVCMFECMFECAYLLFLSLLFIIIVNFKNHDMFHLFHPINFKIHHFNFESLV